jgi:hypothetical protein
MHEALMQARLYCHLRDTGQTGAHLAHVPEAFFAATLPDLGRVLGMQRVDVPLLRFAGEQRSIQPLRDVLHKVCELLVVLQRDLAFMHGDLHGENAPRQRARRGFGSGHCRRSSIATSTRGCALDLAAPAPAVNAPIVLAERPRERRAELRAAAARRRRGVTVALFLERAETTHDHLLH